MMGHEFKTAFKLLYGKGGHVVPCRFEWWEKTNYPYIKNMAPNTWTELTAHESTALSFQHWKGQQESCAGEETVEDSDPPGQSTRDAEGKPRTRTRVLEFWIAVKAGKDCACDREGGPGKQAVIKAKQVLSVVKGVPDWKNSSFTSTLAWDAKKP